MTLGHEETQGEPHSNRNKEKDAVLDDREGEMALGLGSNTER